MVRIREVLQLQCNLAQVVSLERIMMSSNHVWERVRQWTQNCNRRPGRASSVISARGLLSLPLPQASIDPAIDCSSQCRSASAALSMHHMPLSAFLSYVALNKQ